MSACRTARSRDQDLDRPSGPVHQQPGVERRNPEDMSRGTERPVAARTLFDPSSTGGGGHDRQRRGARDALAVNPGRPRSPALRHTDVPAPRSPLRNPPARTGRTRRVDDDFDDDHDFVRDDNKYLVRTGEEDDRRGKVHVDDSGDLVGRDEDYRNRARKEARQARLDDSDENSDFYEPRHRRNDGRDDGRPPRQHRAAEAGKYAPPAVDHTTSAEGLHSWGRRQQGDDSDARRGQAASSGRYQGQGPMRMLFNPNVHDPLKFQQTPSVSTGSGSNVTGNTQATSRIGYPYRGSSSIGTSISAESHMDRGRSSKHPASKLMIPMILDEDDEEEQNRADKERERRKRKEGSEKGSQAKRRGEDDGKSKGSRSSEGSESLRDRERGRGK